MGSKQPCNHRCAFNIAIKVIKHSGVPQDTSSSGDNEKRLETESSNDMRSIEKSIKEKKEEVSHIRELVAADLS